MVSSDMFEDDEISLKWGTLKGWNVKKPETLALLQEYHDSPVSMSVMLQKDTDRQKEILCEMIRQHDGKIYLSWDGKYVGKDEAIDYIMKYGSS